MKAKLMTAKVVLAIALSGCGGDDGGDSPSKGGSAGSGGGVMGGFGGASAGAGSNTGSTSGSGAGAASAGSGGSNAGSGGTTAGAAGGGAGGKGGAGGAGGCMRAPSSDKNCADNVPEAPQAYSCADLASGKALDDSHDNKCWNGNFVPGATFGYCCPP